MLQIQCLARMKVFSIFLLVVACTEGRSSFSDKTSTLPLRPYPLINNTERDIPLPGSKHSPDPLVNAIWPEDTRQDEFQMYILHPKSVHTNSPDSFVDLHCLVEGACANRSLTVIGEGSFRVDFGVESAGWLEIVTDDIPPSLYANLTLSLSEDNTQYPGKILQPKAYPGGVYRIETNPYIYEGIRFGFVNVNFGDGKDIKWHINEVRAVAQTLPVPYKGFFHAKDDAELTSMWYTAAFCPKLNMATQPLPGMLRPSKFMLNSILMDRGDRIGWTGDDHISQMAIMKAFGQHDFIRQNLWNTHNNSNSIATYSIYWILSVLDYYEESGDHRTLQSYIPNIEAKLDTALTSEGSHVVWGLKGYPWNKRPSLTFVGWDERLGSGFENASCTESQRLYSMLTLRATKRYVADLQTLPEKYRYEKHTKKYANAAKRIIQNVRGILGDKTWYNYFEMHSISEALLVPNLTSAEEREKIYYMYFRNQTSQICSFSSFNQFFILKAIGSIEGRIDEAVEVARLCWGGQNKIGATTYFETFSPTWLEAFNRNDRLPTFGNGRTSHCHPWASGILTWITESLLGVTATKPGYKEWDFFPARFENISGTVPLPNGREIKIDLTVHQSVVLNIIVPRDTRATVYMPLFNSPLRSMQHNCNSRNAGLETLLLDSDLAENVKLTSKKLNESIGLCYAVIGDELHPGKHTLEWKGQKMFVNAPDFSLPPPIYDANLIGSDRVTDGTVWHDFYGKDGWVMFSPVTAGVNIISLPSSINFSSYIWQNRYPEGTFYGEKNSSSCALKIPGKKEYGLGTILNFNHTNYINSYIDFVFKDGRFRNGSSLKISLYMCDWPTSSPTIDSQWSRKVGIVAFDRVTMNIVSPIAVIENFQGGIWMSWNYSKSVRFRIVAVEGNGPTLSAVAFDAI